MAEITFEIKRNIAVLSTNSKSGWTREVNMVSWSGAPEKLDIRDWSPDHTHMGKGVSLNASEVEELKKALAEL